MGYMPIDIKQDFKKKPGTMFRAFLLAERGIIFIQIFLISFLYVAM